MLLTTLRLHDFRSYRQVLLSPPEGVTVLWGVNGAGKTNLLEAVHLCCLGRSHRTSQDGEMIRDGCETAAVQLTVARRDGRHEVGVRLYNNQQRKKLLYINGKTASRMGEMIGHATCVIFSPEDLSLVKDGPSARRRFLDMLLSQESPGYFYALQKYMAALKQRNALLRGGDTRSLPAWDEQLADAAVRLTQERQRAVRTINELAREHYRYISGRDEETFALRYQGTLAQSDSPLEDMLRALRDARLNDLKRMTTSVGPHRDEIVLSLSGTDCRAYASQGQSRTAALSLKLSAFDMLKKAQGEPPLLLLDDVLSELDPDRRRRLIARIHTVQALLTCTDRSDFIGAEPACVLRVDHGELMEETL